MAYTDAEVKAAKSFSTKLRNYLIKRPQYKLKHPVGNKGPDLNGPIIQFLGGNPSFWRLWWKVLENQMIMELGRDGAPNGKDYLGLAEHIARPDDMILERAQDSKNHPQHDYLILPTGKVDLTVEFYDQIEVVEHAVRQALRLVGLRDLIRKQMRIRDEEAERPNG